jgi:predicted esterase
VFTTKEFLSKFEKEAKQLGLGRTVELETPEVFCEFFERESPVTRLIVDPGKNSESWTPSLEMALDHIRRAPFGYFNAFIGEPGQCSQCTQKYLMAEVQICPGCRKGLCKNCLPKDRHNCGTVFQTTFVPDDPHGFEAGKLSVPNVSEKVLILFLHGSGPDAEVDVYVPLGEFSSTPRVIRNLAGANIGGKEILVCAIGDRIPACPPMSIARGNDSKIIRRFERLGAIIKAFTNAGYPSEQIFIAGHSAGAWVGLWGLATNPDAFAGIIGFAPAFAGHFGKRQAGFEELRKLAIDQIQKAKSLPSLIYLFQGDEFEAPHELEPVFANVPSVLDLFEHSLHDVISVMNKRIVMQRIVTR